MKLSAFLVQCVLLLTINYHQANADLEETGPGNDLILGSRVDGDYQALNTIISIPARQNLVIRIPFMNFGFGMFTHINATAIEPGKATLLAGGIRFSFVLMKLESGLGTPLKYSMKLYKRAY